MKNVFFVAALLMVLLSAPLYAVDSEALTPILSPIIVEPHVPLVPIMPLPCGTATVVLELSSVDSTANSAVEPFVVHTITYDLKVSGTSIARLISVYNRYSASGTGFVALEDTIITNDGNIRIYGRASNSDFGNMGATGVIAGVTINSVEQPIKGTYSYTSVGGKDSLCIFAH